MQVVICMLDLYKCRIFFAIRLAPVMILFYTSLVFHDNGQKIGPYGPELIWYFGTELAKNTQLNLNGPYVKAHEV